MEKLQAFDFEWVLCGHGQRVYLPLPEMKNQLLSLIDRMKAG